jgi:CAAX prenyl protease-like protein
MLQLLKTWRENRTYAHTVPFGVFMVFMLLYQFVGGAIEWKHEDAIWFRRWPEQLFYPLQSILTFLLLLFFWKHYEFRWTPKVWLGVLAGLVGIGFWLLPTTLYDYWAMTGEPESFLEKLSGLAPRKEGFDPGVFESPWAFWASLLLRIFRAVIVVALVEEIFWRGWLMRFLLDPDRDYWKVPFGSPSWLSYFVVTGAFILAHQSVDYAGAFLYGSLTYGVAVWTRSLLACVVMHAVANFSLAAYAMAYAKYGMW